jgi:hypothetical protein
MTRAELRTFLESGVTALNAYAPYSDVTFGSGRITEWNSNRSNEYPGVWWESIVEDSVTIINQVLPQDDFPILLHIGKLDKADSVPLQYEAIIDDCHVYAQQLIYQYNQIITDSDTLVLSGITRTPFVKKHADCLSGVILSFTITAPDTSPQCL